MSAFKGAARSSLKIITVAFMCVVICLFTGCNNKDLANKDADLPLEKEEKPIELKISCVGDVMVHSPQIPAQYDSATGSYDFSNNFKYVKPYIEDADFALCNLETTFGGGPNYSGYPLFNTPDSLANALKEAGWDMALTSNNHMLDTGVDGLKRTLEVSSAAGLLTSGSQLSEEKNYTITKVKGVNIGVVSYTYETMKQNDRRSINGNPIPIESEPLINSFDYGSLEADLNEIFGSINSAREEGAEIIICYFHWGQEYSQTPDQYEKRIATEIAAAGADIIFASHPHVIQPMEMLEVAATGKKIPVFYSMGNFISNQRAETLNLTNINSRYTEQGIIAEVELEYMKSTKEIVSTNMSAIPLWVEKYWKSGKNFYSVIPIISPEFETNPELQASGHLDRATQALLDIKSIVGVDYVKGTSHGAI